MKHLRTLSASLMMLLFCCYYTGISMFSHTHIVNGTSIVHSHFGGDDGHEHSESQYAVIDMLSQFQSETAADFYSQNILPCTPSEIHIGYSAPAYLSDASDALKLRGPPQA